MSEVKDTHSSKTLSTRVIIIIATISGAFAILLLLAIVYVWRWRTRRPENDRNSNIDQSTWMDSPHTSFWGIQSPFHAKDDNSTTSSIPSLTPSHQPKHRYNHSTTSSIPSMTPLRPVRRTLPDMSPPPTAHYATPSPTGLYPHRNISPDRMA